MDPKDSGLDRPLGAKHTIGISVERNKKSFHNIMLIGWNDVVCIC